MSESELQQLLDQGVNVNKLLQGALEHTCTMVQHCLVLHEWLDTHQATEKPCYNCRLVRFNLQIVQLKQVA